MVTLVNNTVKKQEENQKVDQQPEGTEQEEQEEQDVYTLPSYFDNVSWIRWLLFSWAEPIIETGQVKDKFKMEDMGGLTERYQVEPRMDTLKSNYKETKSMMWSIARTFKNDYGTIYSIRLV